MRKFLLILVIALLAVGSIQAQQVVGDGEGDDAADGPQSSFTLFAVICETQAVLNWGGTMLPGSDLYYQVFGGSQGTGGALTALRRLQVDGQFSFSETVAYNEGGTVAAGGIGSVYVSISAEGNPDNSTYSEFIDDIQDGCAEPQSPTGTAGTPVDGSAPTTGTTTSDRSPGTRSDGTSNILSPFGGVVNPNYIPPAKPLVVVGPREEFVMPRQETPGLIFAECDDYPVAEPGVVYDNDNIVVFWSWFTDTRAQMEDHLENVNYSVTYYQVLALPNVTQTEIQTIGGNAWVFFYANLGNLRPGQYYIEYKVSWDEPVSDGFDTYGPGTDNEVLVSGCSFDVIPNLEGRDVNYNSWPYLGG